MTVAHGWTYLPESRSVTTGPRIPHNPSMGTIENDIDRFIQASPTNFLLVRRGRIHWTWLPSLLDSRPPSRCLLAAHASPEPSQSTVGTASPPPGPPQAGRCFCRPVGGDSPCGTVLGGPCVSGDRDRSWVCLSTFPGNTLNNNSLAT